MAKISYRLKNRYNITKENWQSDCQFSKKLAVLRIIDDWTQRLNFIKFSKWVHQKKDKLILQYLYSTLEKIINKYKDDDYLGEHIENTPIWVCWWSGKERAPDLVKQCIKSIQRYSGCHPVHLITQNTYKDYLYVPQFILDRVENKGMCLAHLSDYLRMSLLEKYGGLWLDATIFCSNEIPEEYFEIPFFTCKSIPIECRFISKYRWTTFCIGGWKNNVFYRFLKEALECYWKVENKDIDYLFLDYIIEIAYCNIDKIKQQMDDLKINNLHRDDLQAAMNRVEPAEMFQTILNDDTVFYKLSWREEYLLKTNKGKDSIYAYFLQQNIETN